MIKVDVLENGSLLILERTVSDSVKFEKIKFSFPESWKDFAKTAVFKNGDKAVEILLNSGSDYCPGKDECFVPFEVIKPPFFTVSVFGSRGDTRATTTRGEIEVLESGYEMGDAPKEPTQSIYEQILDEAKNATQIAQTVRADVESGKLKGPKGDKGEKGDKGDPGKDAIVEHSFNPESENAQSGKAVAEAVRTQVETSGLIETLKEQNKGEKLTFWIGTQAEYDAIINKVPGCFYIIEDDVEEGVSGIWKYKKFANGDSECVALFDVSITTKDVADDGTTLCVGLDNGTSFPEGLFKEAPVCICSVTGTGYMHNTIHELSNTQVRLRYMTAWAVSGAVARVSIIAKGRWK